MLINLNSITPDGLHLDYSEKLPVPKGYGEGHMEMAFEGRISSKKGGRYELLGNLSIAGRGVCDKCLKPAAYEVSDLIFEIFSNSPQNGDDWPVGEGSIEIQEAINANIFMLLPMKISCSDHCKGLCPRCGKDLNEGECGCEGPLDPRFDILSSFFKSEEV